ncbi:MAG TPA: DUF4886 domain-containing protein [Lentisphaeria bacterium]|nr:DUF4886 domain-containing protein [Lentisphaeria bacterium]
MTRLLHSLLTSLLLILPLALTAQENNPDKSAPAEKRQIKLLAVGNSFSGNASKFLKDIVKDSGNCELVFAHASIGGCPLEKHYSLAMKHEANPDDPEGTPYTLNGKKSGLKEMLLADKWQYVTIQQFSVISFKIESYRPHAKNLYDYIRKYAPDAEIGIHQTWAYRPDDKALFKDGFDSVKMYQKLTDAYYTIAKELGCKVIPVGTAFQLAYESPEWEFKRDENFDPKNAKPPELPKEQHSLHAGYYWKDKKLTFDTHHANFAGEYLGGCVWFEFFFKEDVRKIKFKPSKMSEQDAAFLRDIAHKVVSESIKPKAGN